MIRIIVAAAAALLGALVIAIGSALAQGGQVTEGLPPQGDLYNDAVLFARVIPIAIALGVVFGIWHGRVGLREKKSSPESPVVIRHDWGTVIGHWMNAAGFIVGMLTGAIILRWVPGFTDTRTIFVIHYIAAGFALFGVAMHLTQHGITGGMGLIPRTLKDLRDGIAGLAEYSGVYGPEGAAFHLNLPKGLRNVLAETLRGFGIRPVKQLDKYLPAEKVFSYAPWAIIIGVIVVTGLVKSFRYLYPIPPEFVAQMTTLHDLFTILAAIMLVLHLSAVILVPHHWPLLLSMFTTRIKRAYVEKWHPLWFEKLVKREKDKTSPEPSTSTHPVPPKPA